MDEIMDYSDNEDVKVYTFMEIAEILQVGRTTMYKIMKSKHPIPFVGIGTAKRIDSVSFQKWMHDNAGKRIFR